MTALFRKYLRDYRDDLKKGVLELWERGELELHTEKEISVRMNCLTEMADLPFAAIVEFYRQIDEIEREVTGEVG